MSYDYRTIEAVPLSEVDLTSGRKSLVTAIVTPLDAQRLLENNTQNRRINQNTVFRYALDMESGQWDWCEADGPLKVGAGGVLRNGQHRLTAQVLANVTGAYDIRTGVPEESYKHTDSGVARIVADYFYGKERANEVSATALRILYAAYGYTEPTGSMKGISAGIPTRGETIEFAEANYEDIAWYVRIAARIRGQNSRGGISAYAASLYISGEPKNAIEGFTQAYVDGDDSTSITKQTTLKKLMDRNFKPRPHWFGGITLLAYDAWKQGRGVRILRLPDVEKRYKAAVGAFAADRGKTLRQEADR